MDRDAFLDAIVQEPDDEGLRLVYADWLEERGDPLAQFIRVQCELEHCRLDDPRRAELEEAEAGLLADHEMEWVEPLSPLLAASPNSSPPWRFRRGFVEWVALTGGGFLRSAGELFRRTPIREVRLINAGPAMMAIGASPYLSRVEVLEVRGTSPGIAGSETMGYAGARALALSPHLARLRVLDLRWNCLGAGGLAVLLTTSNLASLNTLGLGGNEIGAEGIRILSRSPVLSHLRALNLWSNGIGDAGALVLAQSAAVASLVWLDLGCNAIGLPGVEALASSPFWLRLERLHLWGNMLGNRCAEVLAQSPSWPRLKELHLGANHITNAGVEALMASPFLGNLRAIHLDANPIIDPTRRRVRSCFGDRISL